MNWPANTPALPPLQTLLQRLIDGAKAKVPHSDFHPLTYVGPLVGLSVPELKLLSAALCDPMSDARQTLGGQGIDFISMGVPKNLSQAYIRTSATASKWVAPPRPPVPTEQELEDELAAILSKPKQQKELLQ